MVPLLWPAVFLFAGDVGQRGKVKLNVACAVAAVLCVCFLEMWALWKSRQSQQSGQSSVKGYKALVALGRSTCS